MVTYLETIFGDYARKKPSRRVIGFSIHVYSYEHRCAYTEATTNILDPFPSLYFNVFHKSFLCTHPNIP